MRKVIYSLPNCLPCKTVKARMFRLGEEYEEVVITKEIADQLNIRSVPTMIVYDGEEELGRIAGVPDVGMLTNFLKGIIKDEN